MEELRFNLRVLGVTTICMRVVSFTPRSFYPGGKSRLYPLGGRLDRRRETYLAPARNRRQVPLFSSSLLTHYTD